MNCKLTLFPHSYYFCFLDQASAHEFIFCHNSDSSGFPPLIKEFLIVQQSFLNHDIQVGLL